LGKYTKKCGLQIFGGTILSVKYLNFSWFCACKSPGGHLQKFLLAKKCLHALGWAALKYKI
jgi:hypothetical protein